MDPLTAALAAQAIVAALEIYRVHSGKPAGWIPAAADWDELEAFGRKTPDDIKREAAARLGVPWTPAEKDTPQAPV
jgi:hypothetical protein